jgi:hypothetical protein
MAAGCQSRSFQRLGRVREDDGIARLGFGKPWCEWGASQHATGGWRPRGGSSGFDSAFRGHASIDTGCEHEAIDAERINAAFGQHRRSWRIGFASVSLTLNHEPIRERERIRRRWRSRSFRQPARRLKPQR